MLSLVLLGAKRTAALLVVTVATAALPAPVALGDVIPVQKPGSPAPLDPNQAKIDQLKQEIKAIDQQIDDTKKVIGEMEQEIAIHQNGIQSLNVNMADLQAMIAELQTSTKDLTKRLEHAQALDKALVGEVAWAKSQISIWTKGNPLTPHGGAFGSSPSQPPQVTAISGGILANDLGGPCWGTQDPSIAAANQLLGRSFPNDLGPIAVSHGKCDSKDSIAKTLSAFVSAHRPKGDGNTSAAMMVNALKGYRSALELMVSEAGAEVAAVAKQKSEVEARVPYCEKKIEECKELNKQLEEQIKHLAEQIKGLQNLLDELQTKRSMLQEQLAALTPK